VNTIVMTQWHNCDDSANKGRRRFSPPHLLIDLSVGRVHRVLEQLHGRLLALHLNEDASSHARLVSKLPERASGQLVDGGDTVEGRDGELAVVVGPLRPAVGGAVAVGNRDGAHPAGAEVHEPFHPAKGEEEDGKVEGNEDGLEGEEDGRRHGCSMYV